MNQSHIASAAAKAGADQSEERCIRVECSGCAPFLAGEARGEGEARGDGDARHDPGQNFQILYETI